MCLLLKSSLVFFIPSQTSPTFQLAWFSRSSTPVLKVHVQYLFSAGSGHSPTLRGCCPLPPLRPWDIPNLQGLLQGPPPSWRLPQLQTTSPNSELSHFILMPLVAFIAFWLNYTFLGPYVVLFTFLKLPWRGFLQPLRPPLAEQVQEWVVAPVLCATLLHVPYRVPGS